eukprot:SAG31_NODE_2200_length_6208_cov_2.781306_4_plen_135_part_00
MLNESTARAARRARARPIPAQIKMGLLALKSLLGLACLAVPASAAEKPNAVFILVDDLGHNDVAYNNRSADGKTAGRLIQSPNIDKMADTGLKLLQYYVQPICTPTRLVYPMRIQPCSQLRHNLASHRTPLVHP